MLDHGSAFDTLRHLVDVDWSWREFCTGNDVGETYVWDHGFVLDDLAAIHAFCLEEDGRLRSYVESLDQAGLNEPLADGDPREPRWLVVAHVVNHGTQHRSELARYLTECWTLAGRPRPPGRCPSAVARQLTDDRRTEPATSLHASPPARRVDVVLMYRAVVGSRAQGCSRAVAEAGG